MNRQEAKAMIGKYIAVNEGNKGTYVGQLLEVMTPPQSTWEGIVRITGVLSIPLIEVDALDTVNLLFAENEKVHVSGRKITSLDKPFHGNFNESLAVALKEAWDIAHDENTRYEKTLSFLQQELRKLNAEHLIYEDAFVYYQLVKKGRKLYIYDEKKRESLSLEGCPFEFEIKVNNEWQTAYYKKGFTFETSSQDKIELKHGSTVRLNKAQFDPYKILLNELDEPSLNALERGLEKLEIGHENSVYCHNSLLIHLLSSFNQSFFSGVNFISYATETNQFIVQHHYERTMRDDEPDITFDRFEFTSDKGERVLTTYATQLSNE
ncbi:DUF2777 domain-containing protein [Salipaludibacillus sp. LMS25]|jgi:hypothetical protein|uniref:DUF2777 family protein n=1 Tax=Salipaludibacillus sp. LMS25 TaxID=2924031 RepID=UPI0020D14EA2|nr:DUF2777 family protein [Salipaludibacillus sp. LMS25]UTR14685.1 DUF2777 domain-containing protein [Salipaludibacillus sp. LMS25]